jgi:hypothetical protein
MSSSYQVVLWKQESFVVLRPLQIEFFRNLLGRKYLISTTQMPVYSTRPSALQFSNENGCVAGHDVGVGYNVRWRPDGNRHPSRRCPIQWGHTLASR